MVRIFKVLLSEILILLRLKDKKYLLFILFILQKNFNNNWNIKVNKKKDCLLLAILEQYSPQIDFYIH